MNDDVLLLKNQLCFPTYLCSKEIIRRYNIFLKPLNLTYTQYIVMMYFWEMKSGNVKEIAHTLLIDSSTLTPLLRSLENKGYVKRERSTKDERNLIITLTNKGIELREKAKLVPIQMGKCMNLTDNEAKTLYKLLYKVLNNVENDLKKIGE